MLAFEALRFGAGVAADAADIVAWCDICGFGGATALARRLPALEIEAASGFPSCEPDGELIDASGGSLLRIGTAALDYGYAEHHTGTLKRVKLANVSDLEFAPGLAAIAARRGMDAILAWQVDGHHVTACCNGAKRTVDIDLADSAEAELSQLVITFGDGNQDRIVGADRITADVLKARADRSLVDGIHIESGTWNAVLAVAKKRLVPESDRSRERGAGIGANDEG